MSDLQKIGADWGGAGDFKALTAGISGAQRITDAHARFMDAAVSGRLFEGGMTLTSISNVTFTTATLGATCTPIIGVWNPLTSPRNLIIAQARLLPVITALQVTGAGALVWATAVGQSAITTGNKPLNRGNLGATGSFAVDMSGVALTGLAGNLTVRYASTLGSGAISNLSTLQTAAGLMPPQFASVDNIDGSLVVPPGGVLALLATGTPVAISAASALLWEETPLLVTL